MAKAKATKTRKKKLTQTFNDVFEASVDANIENFIAEKGNGSVVEDDTIEWSAELRPKVCKYQGYFY